jgi:hypothetical protein
MGWVQGGMRVVKHKPIAIRGVYNSSDYIRLFVTNKMYSFKSIYCNVYTGICVIYRYIMLNTTLLLEYIYYSIQSNRPNLGSRGRETYSSLQYIQWKL